MRVSAYVDRSYKKYRMTTGPTLVADQRSELKTKYKITLNFFNFYQVASFLDVYKELLLGGLGDTD